MWKIKGNETDELLNRMTAFSIVESGGCMNSDLIKSCAILMMPQSLDRDAAVETFVA